jgi:prepilin-type N-terminal cleavage/methylation domain-containing protein
VRRAFTLVELLAVITVVVILASVVIGALRSCDTARNQDRHQLPDRTLPELP